MALPVSPAVPARPRVVPASWPLARTALAVAALWAVPAAIALGQVYIQQTLAGQPVDWPAALWTTLPNWILWALLTPAVVEVAARNEPGRVAGGRIALVLAGTGALALAAHALGNVAAFRIGGLPSDWTWGTFETHYTLRFHVNVVAFGLIVAATWALLALGRARARDAREARLQAALSDAELRALRTQVRPHFLFNALHTVGATVRLGETERAVTLLRQLGDLLRASLESDGAAEVPLAREIDVLQQYLAVEGARVGDRLRVEWDVEDDARRALLPPWTLQPLVENAVKYGVASHSGPARIGIRARVESGRLRVTVEDDGPGPGATVAAGTGVGISNTRSRLEAVYDGDAALTLRPGVDGGAVAALDVPFRTAP